MDVLKFGELILDIKDFIQVMNIGKDCILMM